MGLNLIDKLMTEAVETGATYVEFVVSVQNISFTSDGGIRKSTRNYRRTAAEIHADERVLKRISDRNLLFSKQLNKITVTLMDGRSAVFNRCDNGKYCTVTARRVSEKKEKRFSYVRFFADDLQDTGIAFLLKTLNNGKTQIVSCTGEILKGVISTDLSTDLQFVLSGRFYSQNGLPDSNFDKENQQTIDSLALVMQGAIKEMLHLRLLSMSLFAVLPNTSDEDSDLTNALIQSLKTVCRTYPVFKNRNGHYLSSLKIADGTDDVTKLFPQVLAESVLNGRMWLEPYKRGGREECFLMDMGIPYFDRERFLKELFTESHFDDCRDILAAQNDKWIRSFYIFCTEPIDENSVKRQIISGFRNICSIRDSKGRMRYPYEISIAADPTETSAQSIIIKPDIISPSGNDDEYSERLRRFFIDDLGITVYSQRPEIEKLAYDLTIKRQTINKNYLSKLLTLASYDKSHPGEIDFQQYAIFPYESSRGLKRVTADKLVIGKPYYREGNLLVSATGREPLWEGVKLLIDNENDLALLLAFIEKCGAIGWPKIVKQTADKHRFFNDKLYTYGRQGARDSNYDFIIPGIEAILRKRSLQLNRMIWSAILSAENPDECLNAEYSAENRKTVNRCESSLLLILRERTWVPGKDGKFYKPENISVNAINDSFSFDKANPILKALGFGMGVKRREKAFKELEKQAAKEGFRLIPENDYLLFLEWKNTGK